MKKNVGNVYIDLNYLRTNFTCKLFNLQTMRSFKKYPFYLKMSINKVKSSRNTLNKSKKKNKKPIN